MFKFFYKLGLLTAAGTALVYQSNVLDSPWWSSLRVVRFGRAACAAFLVTVDYKWSLLHVPEDEQYYIIRSKIHLRSAERLKDMCSKNGGLFIKLGQHVGSLKYLLPSEYVNTFKIFHSDAPSTPLVRLKKVIEEELHKSVDEVFSQIDSTPLGAASIAQCHHGMLKNGQTVAIKIQHPDVKKNAYTDMNTVDFLVDCVTWVFPSFNFRWLAEEVRNKLPNELNFCHEAQNMERFSEMFKHLPFIKAPKVHWEFTTSRLLVMEYCEGGKVDDVSYIRQHKLPVDEISLKLSRLYSEMIFKTGFIHSDPHPGNVFVRKGSKGEVEIILLDHGQYQELTDDFRITYCRLWEGLIRNDKDSVKKYCLALNAGDLYPLLACVITARTWESIQDGIINIRRTEQENEVLRTLAIHHYVEGLSYLFNIIPRQLLLILKTNDLLRGLEHSIGSDVHTRSFLTMSRFCIIAISEEDMKNAKGWHQKWLLRTKTSFRLFIIKVYEWWLRFKLIAV